MRGGKSPPGSLRLTSFLGGMKKIDYLSFVSLDLPTSADTASREWKSLRPVMTIENMKAQARIANRQSHYAYTNGAMWLGVILLCNASLKTPKLIILRQNPSLPTNCASPNRIRQHTARSPDRGFLNLCMVSRLPFIGSARSPCDFPY